MRTDITKDTISFQSQVMKSVDLDRAIVKINSFQPYSWACTWVDLIASYYASFLFLKIEVMSIAETPMWADQKEEDG